MGQLLSRVLLTLLLATYVSVVLVPTIGIQSAFAQDDEDFEVVEEFEEDAGGEDFSDSEGAESEEEFAEEESGDDSEFNESENFDDGNEFAEEAEDIEEELEEFSENNMTKSKPAEEAPVAEEKSAEEPAVDASEQQVTDKELQTDVTDEPAKSEETEEEVGFDEFEEPREEFPAEENMQAEEPPAETTPAEDPNVTTPPSMQASQGFSYDEPNLDYERALHDIYLNYHSKKTSVEEWNKIFGQKETESYNIEVGDSLWKISETIFGDGQYWPKVWSLNGKITNPHLIKEGNVINFVLGSESDAPSFNVTEAEAVDEEAANIQAAAAEQSTQVDQEEGAVAAVVGGDSEIDIPPPLKRSKPVVKMLPPSLPIWQLTQNENDTYDKLGIDYEKRSIVNSREEISLSSYILEQDKDGIGKVIEVEDGNKVASEFQYVYVTVDPGMGDVGETFLVEKSRGKIERANEQIKTVLGYAIDVQGEIQLVEKVDGAMAEKNLFRAIVKKIVNPITVGGFLVKGRIQKVSVSRSGPKNQVEAEIIGGSFSNKRRVFNTESIAYLNKGTMDGLKVGDVLSVRANRKIRYSDSIIKSNVRPIGWLKVVRASDKVATAVVTSSWADIQSGDVTGSGGFSGGMSMSGMDSGFSGEFDDSDGADDTMEKELEEGFGDDF